MSRHQQPKLINSVTDKLPLLPIHTGKNEHLQKLEKKRKAFLVTRSIDLIFEVQ